MAFSALVVAITNSAATPDSSRILTKMGSLAELKLTSNGTRHASASETVALNSRKLNVIETCSKTQYSLNSSIPMLTCVAIDLRRPPLRSGRSSCLDRAVHVSGVHTRQNSPERDDERKCSSHSVAVEAFSEKKLRGFGSALGTSPRLGE